MIRRSKIYREEGEEEKGEGKARKPGARGLDGVMCQFSWIPITYNPGG